MQENWRQLSQGTVKEGGKNWIWLVNWKRMPWLSSLRQMVRMQAVNAKTWEGSWLICVPLPIGKHQSQMVTMRATNGPQLLGSSKCQSCTLNSPAAPLPTAPARRDVQDPGTQPQAWTANAEMRVLLPLPALSGSYVCTVCGVVRLAPDGEVVGTKRDCQATEWWSVPPRQMVRAVAPSVGACCFFSTPSACIPFKLASSEWLFLKCFYLEVKWKCPKLLFRLRAPHGFSIFLYLGIPNSLMHSLIDNYKRWIDKAENQKESSISWLRAQNKIFFPVHFC